MHQSQTPRQNWHRRLEIGVELLRHVVDNRKEPVERVDRDSNDLEHLSQNTSITGHNQHMFLGQYGVHYFWNLFVCESSQIVSQRLTVQLQNILRRLEVHLNGTDSSRDGLLYREILDLDIFHLKHDLTNRLVFILLGHRLPFLPLQNLDVLYLLYVRIQKYVEWSEWGPGKGAWLEKNWWTHRPPPSKRQHRQP